jgi:hypothetical protein
LDNEGVFNDGTIQHFWGEISIQILLIGGVACDLIVDPNSSRI